MIKENAKESIARFIARQQMDLADDSGGWDDLIGFDYYNQLIVNPWIDPSARFELTTPEAKETYGEDAVNRFIDDAVSKSPLVWEYISHLREIIEAVEEQWLEIPEEIRNLLDDEIREGSQFMQLITLLERTTSDMMDIVNRWEIINGYPKEKGGKT